MGGHNLRSSDFDYLNLLQRQKQLSVNIEYHLKNKINMTFCVQKVHVKFKKGTGAMATATNEVSLGY